MRDEQQQEEAVVGGGGVGRWAEAARARTSERIMNDSVHTKKQSVTSWPRLRDSRA